MKKKEKKKWYIEIIPYAIILIIVVLVRSFLITPVRVSGESMYDTLNGGEIMLLNKLGKLQRYSMVVANVEFENKTDDTIIKRIYGLPGESIKCENGYIYINNKKIDDPYAYGKTSDFEEISLKDDEYFLLGDNRAVSLDSRYIGAVDRKKIEGTTSFILWPINRFGIVKNN